MEIIIKTAPTKEIFEAIKEVKASKETRGTTKRGFTFIKTLTNIIIL